MKVNIKAFGRLNDYLDEDFTEEIEYENVSVLELIKQISNKNPESKIILFNESGNLYNNIIIQLNNKRIPVRNAEKTFLKENDEIKIYPAVSGG